MLIIDIGIGNLGSIFNMIRKVGGEPVISSDPNVIRKSNKMILPGVGAFDHGMQRLTDSGLIPILEEMVLQKNVPIIGICLGMQLMLDQSEEGLKKGLGWISGQAKKFRFNDRNLPVPHMGWNTVTPQKNNILFDLEPDEPQRFYFVHSYYVECVNNDDVLTLTNYGSSFCSSFNKKNIYGVQFHPEKSHIFGMRLFKRFLEL